MSSRNPDESALIDALKATFSGQIILPGNADYDRARRVWNGAIDRRPFLIARCASIGDVTATIRLARDTGRLLAVRGGGHSVAGNGTCDLGVVLDLSGLRKVVVDAEARVATAEGGSTWADMDAATGAHGLAVTGGLISSTGIGGLTLGGGIGWLMRRHGLTCDNLLSADVSLADGRSLRASAEENPELFWGLRGGGGNFGVVTRFRYRLHPVSQVLGGMLLFRAERAAELLRFFRTFTAHAPDELTALFVFLTAPPAPFVPEGLRGNPAIAVALCHCGQPANALRDVRELRALGAEADLLAPMPYPALQQMLDAGAPAGLHNHFNSAYLSELSDEAIAALTTHASLRQSPLSQIHIHHLGGAVSRVPEGTTAFSNRDAGYTMNAIAGWVDPAETATHTRWSREAAAALRPFSRSGVYVNFLGDEGPERVRDAYGPQTYERLAALKRTMDPENLFRVNQNIAPRPSASAGCP